MIRNKIIIVIPIAFIALMAFYWLRPKSETMVPSTSVRPTATPFSQPSIIPTTDLQGKKITISGVDVDNFYLNSESNNNQEDILIKNTVAFQIVYLKKQNKFLLSIRSSPFTQKRAEAEEQFLKTLGIERQEACRLNVTITTPFFANPDYAGQEFSLSFCKK